MYTHDYHIHSRFSGDSSESLEAIVKKAIELNLNEISFTDHLEYDVDGMEEHWNLDLENYVKRVLELKDKYKEIITIKLGVEVGLQPHTYDFFNNIIKNYPFDFVIASTHAIHRKDIGSSNIHIGKTKDEMHSLYFENVLQNVKLFKNYSVYGHLDFITRYGGEEFRELDFEKHKNIIDEILTEIIKSGKGIEINTSGFRYKENRFYPSTTIVKRFFQLGGKFLTIGSDSHKKDDLCKEFDLVYKFLKEIGVENLTSFEKMIPTLKKIK